MSLGIAGSRLMQERKNWRKEHPAGWYARPMSKSDGSTSLMKWECGIKGPEHTCWEGGLYKVVLEFTEDYPTKPPTCKFVPPLFHPNVYASGRICLSIINDGGDWKPAITIKQILIGIRDLLDAPNTADPANGQASGMFVNQRAEYDELVRAEAKKNAP